MIDTYKERIKSENESTKLHQEHVERFHFMRFMEV